MLSIKYPGLQKRYLYYGNGNYNGARWAFFALFILVILFLLLYTLRINKRRLRTGSKPIAGTAWMTPPSYFQSQTQYNEPLNSTNVPPYSENTLPNDAGYYDNQGNFIANPQYQPQQPPKGGIVTDETGGTSNGGYSRPNAPPPSHSRSQTGNTFNTNPDVENGYYNNSNNNNSNTYETDEYDDLELHNFTRPAGPPPAHLSSPKN